MDTATQAAVDVGYGFTKGVVSSAAPSTLAGRRAIFPSAVASDPGGEDLRAALGARAGTGRVSILRAGAAREDWVIGEDALLSGAARTWDEKGADRYGYDVLVLAALASLGVAGAVELTVGLPLGAYLRRGQRDALRGRLGGMNAWVSAADRDAQAIFLTAVRVAPQGLGALQHQMRQGPPSRARTIGVLDVGYRTTDYLLCTRKGAGLIPDPQRCGTVQKGMGEAMDALRRYVMARSDLTSPPADAYLETALAGDGSLPVNGAVLRIVDAWADACREVAVAVESRIRRVWGEALPFLGAVFLAGGGGAALHPHLSLPGATVCEDAVWANAMGFVGD